MEKTNLSEVKVKIEALSNSSTSLENKKSNVEFLLCSGLKNKDFVDIVKEGGIVLTTLLKSTDDIDLKVKITTLLLFLSLNGHSGPTIEKMINDINILSLINLFSEKDFRVFIQAFDGLKILGEQAVASSSTIASITKSNISFSLSAATLFLENMTTLINPSSKLLSNDQKTQALGKFSEFVMTGVMVQAAADAAKDFSSELSKNFSLAYSNFEKTLESCRIGNYSLLDLIVTQLLQMIKEGKLVAGVPPPEGGLGPYLTIINQWLGGFKKFNILYQASKDGKAISTFHGKCNGKGATVTIVTSSEGYVFGGYTPVAWNSIGDYAADKSNQSFLFSLKNPRNDQPTKFSYKPGQHAVYDDSTYGPTFGGGHDITCGYSSNVGESAYTNLGHSYNNTTGLASTAVFTGQQYYNLKDVEVYQVQ